MGEASRPGDEAYTRRAADVIEKEQELICKRTGSEKSDGFAGLALSGGGIRSAAFALGFLQALARADVLRRFHYLSTVSGGGYIGAALTWFLSRSWSPDGTNKVDFGVGPADRGNGIFPLGVAGKGARDDVDRGTAEGLASAILTYIRQHGNYLYPRACLGPTGLVAVVVRAILTSVFVYGALAVVGVWVAMATGALSPIVSLPAWAPAQTNAVLALAGLLVALLLLSFPVYGVLTAIKRGPSLGYALRTRVQCAMGVALSAAIVLAVLGSLPLAHEVLTRDGSGLSTMLGSSGAAAGVALAIARFLWQWRSAGGGRPSWVGRLLPVIAALLLIYGSLLIAYAAADGLAWPGAIGLFAAALVVGLVVDLNRVSLHRVYRDRLAETFLPGIAAIVKNRWQRAEEADAALLEEMCTEDRPGPYHLMNANVVLVDAEDPRYRGRGGDNFILSPLYCGSEATGWRRTETYMKREPLMRGMSLPTAMALSGAAVNPATGAGGVGVTRDPWVSFVMTLLNLRLGYLAPNPRYPEWARFPPNYLIPGAKGLLMGLARIAGWGFDERDRFLELTDGYHFENLGLYELVRRRLRLIVVADAGADPEALFADLGLAVERVRADFGADIRFRNGDYDLGSLVPGSAGDDLLAARFGLARRGFAVGTVAYDGGETGHLVVVKTTMTRGLPGDLYAYKAAHPAFPDQATVDQFFDEIQFDAYRELGYRLTKAMLIETEQLSAERLGVMARPT